MNYADVDWTQANCLGTDHQSFFPEAEQWTTENKAAVRVCQSCPILNDCFAYAVKHEYHGIWGGTNAAGRPRYRAKMRLRNAA